MNAQSATYKRVSRLARKNILPVWKKVVLLQRSNFVSGMRTAGKSSQPFLYPFINNRQSDRVVVCGSGNAHKDELASPEQHHSPFLFNVLKIHKMTARQQMINGSYEERKNAMMQLLEKSGTAFMVYLDENCQIRTCGIAEDGYESMLLPMLDIATNKARRVAEEAMV